MFLDRNFYSFICTVTAIFFATYLASLPIDSFVDRNNYLIYASSTEAILFARLAKGALYATFNEPLWGLINLTLGSFLSPQNTVRAVIALSTFITFFLVLKNIPKKFFFLGLLFLLLPQVLKNNIIHLRQGLAVAVFLIGWFSQKNQTRFSFFLAAAFIHSSFMIVLVSLILIEFFENFSWSNGVKTLTYIIVSLSIGLFGLALAQLLGARQAEAYQEITSEASGLAFLFWLGILLIYLLEGNAFIKNNLVSVFFLVLYLCTYFLLPVSARVFESVLLIILLSSLYLKLKNRIYFYLFIGFYFVYTWAGRIPLVGFGWDVVNYQ
jgi:hypothetical protein